MRADATAAICTMACHSLGLVGLLDLEPIRSRGEARKPYCGAPKEDRHGWIAGVSNAWLRSDHGSDKNSGRSPLGTIILRTAARFSHVLERGQACTRSRKPDAPAYLELTYIVRLLPQSAQKGFQASLSDFPIRHDRVE